MWVIYVFLDREKKGVKETKISELLVQRLSTEPKLVGIHGKNQEILFRLNMKR